MTRPMPITSGGRSNWSGASVLLHVLNAALRRRRTRPDAMRTRLSIPYYGFLVGVGTGLPAGSVSFPLICETTRWLNAAFALAALLLIKKPTDPDEKEESLMVLSH